MLIYDATCMAPLCGRSVVLPMVVREDIGKVIYEAVTPHCLSEWI